MKLVMCLFFKNGETCTENVVFSVVSQTTKRTLCFAHDERASGQEPTSKTRKSDGKPPLKIERVWPVKYSLFEGASKQEPKRKFWAGYAVEGGPSSPVQAAATRGGEAFKKS